MQSYKGTVAELVQQGITVNGVALDQPTLSLLTRIGRGDFIKAVGVAKKAEGTRGKAATIWEVNPTGALSFTLVASNGTATKATVSSVESAPEAEDQDDEGVSAPRGMPAYFAPAAL